MKITFYQPGIFKNHEKKQYYKMHLKLEFTILIDFSVELGYLCSFSKSGNPQIYPYVQGGRKRMWKPVIYFEILLDLVCILNFLSNFSTCSIQQIHSGSQHPSFLPALFFLFLKGFVGKKRAHSFEKILLPHSSICIRGILALLQLMKYLMRHNSRSF